jgi:hypothetical protein
MATSKTNMVKQNSSSILQDFNFIKKISNESYLKK